MAKPRRRKPVKSNQVAQIRRILKKHGDPQWRYAKDLAAASRISGRPWQLIAAIAQAESSGGRYTPANAPFNYWGWSVYTGKQSSAITSPFKNPHTAYRFYAKGLRKGYSGGNSIYDPVWEKYAASPAWQGNVASFMKKYGANPNAMGGANAAPGGGGGGGGGGAKGWKVPQNQAKMKKLRQFVLMELSAGTEAKDLLPMVLLAKSMMGGGGGGKGGKGGKAGQGTGPGTGRVTRTGSFVNPLPTRFGGSAFRVQDAEGAPGPGGRYHAAADWFAPGGTKVRAAISGKIVEVKVSRGRSGQVFGGVVKIQGPNGRVFVYRHVDPRRLRVGQRVKAGDIVASVTKWTGGSSHVHLEIWKTLAGGYNLSNMIDPATYFG